LPKSGRRERSAAREASRQARGAGLDRRAPRHVRRPRVKDTANSCPGTIIHFVAAALLLTHAARPPRRPSRLGLGRRLASWHPRKKRRPPTAGDLTARAAQQPNPKTRAAGHLLLPTSIRPLVARISCPRFHNATIASVICTRRPRSIGVLLVGMLWWHPTNASRRSAIGLDGFNIET
jgi:hypothetical protein